MARIARLTGVQHGSGPTAITGVRAISFGPVNTIRRSGKSDAEIGQTSLDIVGYQISGTITFDDLASALTTSALGQVDDLAVKYKAAGGTDKTETLERAFVGSFDQAEFPDKGEGGETGTFIVPFTGMVDAATTLAQLVVIA